MWGGGKGKRAMEGRKRVNKKREARKEKKKREKKGGVDEEEGVMRAMGEEEKRGGRGVTMLKGGEGEDGNSGEGR